MILKPNQKWHWIFDSDKGVMTLELGAEMLFVSKLSKKRCVPHAQEDLPFCTEHAQLYYAFLDKLDLYNWSAPIKVQIILNAIAVALFNKPMMPQSWFFHAIGDAEQQAEVGDLLLLKSDHQQARFLLLEQNSQTYTLMLIEPNMSLDNNKTIQQFEPIKVMKDRALSVNQFQQGQSYSAAG